MKKLDIYMMKEMIVPFLIGGLSITLMFQINLYMAVAKQFNLSNVPFSAVLKLIIYSTPSFLGLTLPASSSLAASLSMSRLARESELTAIRAAGVSIRRALVPFGYAGILIAIGSWVIVNRITPTADAMAGKLSMQIGLRGRGIEVKSNIPLKFDRQYAMFIGEIDQNLTANYMKVRDVLLVDYQDRKEFRVINAKEAEYKAGYITFKDAYMRTFDGADLLEFRPMKDFVKRWDIVPMQVFDTFQPLIEGPDELKSRIESNKKVGGIYRPEEVKLYQLTSLPVACVVMAFVSPIFAILFAKSGGFGGVLLSSLLVMLYYNIHVICGEILAKYDSIPTWLAAWLPVMLFASIGLLAIRRLE